jgi:GTP-binding protein HflX
VALPSGSLVLLSDTVGFISKLPPTLVAAFRATLEELADADLLVHVEDAVHPNLQERIAVVEETLASLDLAERPRLLVLNRIDLLRGAEGAAVREQLAAELPDAVLTSARTGEGLDVLRERLVRAASAGWKRVRVTLPHRAGAYLQRIRERGALRRADYGVEGIAIEAEVPPALAAELEAASR